MRRRAARTTRFTLAGVGGLAAALILVHAGSAHPLGNFTINHYAGLRIQTTGVDLDVVIDMAEIPAVAERERIDANSDGTIDSAELAQETSVACPRESAQITLTLDGRQLPLTTLQAGLSFPPGQSGVDTLRLVCEYHAAFAGPLAGPATIVFQDRYRIDQIGWHEIVAGGNGTTLSGSGFRAVGVSNRLTAYPLQAGAPIDDELATIRVSPGGPSLAPLVVPDAAPLPGSSAGVGGQAPASADGSGKTGDQPSPLASMVASRGNAANRASPGPPAALAGGAVPGGVQDPIAGILETRNLTPAAIIGSLLVAVALGALHALSPGHGKTVMAAYLVGSRGSARHAIGLGLAVTVSHTAGVFAIAVVVLFASTLLPPERLYPVLGVASGFTVIAIGVVLLWGRLRLWAVARAHPHGFEPEMSAPETAGIDPGEMSHELAQPGGEHSHGPFRHDHGTAVNEVLSWRSLMALGLAGGLVPSASALLLLLGSLAANRPAYGMVLVVAFGAGMAMVLAGVGFLLVHASRFLSRGRPGTAWQRLWEALPFVTALVVIGAGIYLTSQALTQAL